MTTALFMLAGIAAILGIVVLLDWVARRKDRHSKVTAPLKTTNREDVCPKAR